ncbi:hypothetical protein D3C84_792900 [compost metagenome]
MWGNVAYRAAQFVLTTKPDDFIDFTLSQQPFHSFGQAEKAESFEAVLIGEDICFVEHLEGVGLVSVDHRNARASQPPCNGLVDEAEVTCMLEVLIEKHTSLLKFVPLVMHLCQMHCDHRG